MLIVAHTQDREPVFAKKNSMPTSDGLDSPSPDVDRRPES